MDRMAFEAELREQGYGEVVDRRMEANAGNPGAILRTASVCVGPGSAEQRDRTMLRIAGRTLHRVRDTRFRLAVSNENTSRFGKPCRRAGK